MSLPFSGLTSKKRHDEYSGAIPLCAGHPGEWQGHRLPPHDGQGPGSAALQGPADYCDGRGEPGRALGEYTGHHDPEDPGRGVMAAASLIDGRAIARQLQGELVQRIAALKAAGVQPGLAFVRVGEDPASKVNVGRKEKTCAELGFIRRPTCCPT